MAGDRMIMGVTSADASLEQVSIRDLATAHMTQTPGSHRRLPAKRGHP